MVVDLQALTIKVKGSTVGADDSEVIHYATRVIATTGGSRVPSAATFRIRLSSSASANNSLRPFGLL